MLGCAVASHNDAVCGAGEIFVFITSTEKPQAAQPKAIMTEQSPESGHRE